MITPRTTQRLAILVILAVCVLVLGGLAWATFSAVQLQRLEGQAARQRAMDKSFDEARALALSKLDAVVAPVLARELARPYEHFRPYYKPVAAMDERTGGDISATTLVPSPLRTLKGPDWLLLHFQTTETEQREKWSSPQIDNEHFNAVPVWTFSAADRQRLARPENWMEALRERYPPLELLRMLEETLGASHVVVRPTDEPPPRGAGKTARTNYPAGEGDNVGRVTRSAAEFVRRGARLVQMQFEGNPGELCFPEPVAFENLEMGRQLGSLQREGEDCVQVTSTPMKPIWLNLTMDGRRQLAFVRSVSVETGAFCTLQGVLIDWDRLRSVLETEARDLFPAANVVPVENLSATQPNLTHALMQTIPARLETGPPQTASEAELSRGFKVGLTLAWGVTILALAGIAYGTMKYVAMAERRLRFVAAVTHELRTPLTSFQLYSDLLVDMPQEDPTTRRRYAETLRGEAVRLARLVENVLAYSRVGVTQPTLNLREMHIGELLAAARVSSLADFCRGAGKELIVEDLCPTHLTMRTDPELTTRILTNLIENACKYSTGAQDHRIWLSIKSVDDQRMDLEVDDAGPGVSPHDRKAIFQPFRRGSSTDVRNAGGVGLGLALCLYWARCLGGKLIVRRSPRNDGHYSSFVLTLPKCPPRPE